MTKVFYVFALLAALSAGISMSGRWFGHSIAMAGYTDDPTLYSVVIGRDIVTAPGNMIRFQRARQNGVAARLDLYMRWPQLDGYSEAARRDFNNSGGARRLLFIAAEPRIMSRDMSGRFGPIYQSLIEGTGTRIEGGLVLYALKSTSGYMDEQLVVGERDGKNPFVARCLTGAAAEGSLAPCERDIHIGDNLSVTYRFPRELLRQWAVLDASVDAKMTSMLRVAR